MVLNASPADFKCEPLHVFIFATPEKPALERRGL